MKHNRIKIKCNSQGSTLSYQFQNEQMIWVSVSQFSDLAKKEYTETSIRQSASSILNIIKMVYNPGSRGVIISFEGPERDYVYLRQVINKEFSQENISCEQKTIKVAVAGKCGVDKTALIESLFQKRREQYAVTSKTGYRHYKSKSDDTEWFELEGIDLGIENIRKAERTIDVLAKQGLTMFIYCLNSDRVEQTEVQLVQRIREHHPEISLLGILTNTVSLDAETIAEQISRILRIKVLPIMTKDQITRSGTIRAFGHENVLRAVFGGE
jgi:hypothetical protein